MGFDKVLGKGLTWPIPLIAFTVALLTEAQLP